MPPAEGVDVKVGGVAVIAYVEVNELASTAIVLVARRVTLTV